MIKVKTKSNYNKITKYLEKMKAPIDVSKLEKYGQAGVIALQNATPVDSGKTKNSWYYEIENDKGVVKIKFCNSNIAEYIPVAIILQYGHATGTGGWVEGIDYINPAIKPVFNDIKNAAWREVTNR